MFVSHSVNVIKKVRAGEVLMSRVANEVNSTKPVKKVNQNEGRARAENHSQEGRVNPLASGSQLLRAAPSQWPEHGEPRILAPEFRPAAALGKSTKFIYFFLILGYFRDLCEFFSVQSLSCVWLFATQWTTARQASLSITNSGSSLKLMSIESVMPLNHLILCRPLLLLPSIFPSIRVISSELVLCIRWPKYWSFSISPSNEYSGLNSFMIDWLVWSPCSPTDSQIFSNTTVQKHQFFHAQLSFWSNSPIHPWPQEKP